MCIWGYKPAEELIDVPEDQPITAYKRLKIDKRQHRLKPYWVQLKRPVWTISSPFVSGVWSDGRLSSFMGAEITEDPVTHGVYGFKNPQPARGDRNGVFAEIEIWGKVAVYRDRRGPWGRNKDRVRPIPDGYRAQHARIKKIRTEGRFSDSDLDDLRRAFPDVAFVR